MTLLIDAGNSAVKWAVLAVDGTIADAGFLLHRARADVGDALASAWRGRTHPTRAVGCAVAGAEVIDAIERAARALGVAGVEWLGPQPLFTGALALANGYLDPLQLGADRWHALLGARARMPDASFVVANAGTATTVDCVRRAGDSARFVGGCIAPGVRLMLESLAHGTAGLPLAEGPSADFPDTTDKAIVTGVFDAQAGLVERVWRRFASLLGQRPRLLVTGGQAELLAARLPAECAPVIEHNLVLRGLALRVTAAR